jgi:taurine transport system substrate-binding protein
MRRFWLLLALVLAATPALAQKKEVTFGHQDMWNPFRVTIANKELEKATGWTVNWKMFGGGADVMRAMASGDVQMGEAGSSPIAAAVSQGVDVELFWILEDIADAEALVVRNASGINGPKDLKGKKIATPFVSTSHFHLLFALENWGYKPNETQVLNMRPADIGAAWERGDIDGAFIWDPVLSKAKKDGSVIVTSGELSKMGKATFDGIVVSKKFAKENPDFMVGLVKVLAAQDARYRADKAKWTADTPEIQAIAKVTGGKAEDVPAGMALYGFPSLEEQASDKWLGGGKNGGAAKALLATADFLKEQKRIQAALPDYGAVVTSEYVQKAMAK